MIPVEFAFPKFSHDSHEKGFEIVYCLPTKIGEKEVKIEEVGQDDLIKANNGHPGGELSPVTPTSLQNDIGARFRASNRWAAAHGGVGIPLYTEKDGSAKYRIGLIKHNSHCKSLFVSLHDLVSAAGFDWKPEFVRGFKTSYHFAQRLTAIWATQSPDWKFAVPTFEENENGQWITAFDSEAVASIKVHVSQLGGAYEQGTDWKESPVAQRTGWKKRGLEILSDKYSHSEEAIAMTTRWARSELLKVKKHRLKIVLPPKSTIVDVGSSPQGFVENKTTEPIDIVISGGGGALVVASGESVCVMNVKGSISAERYTGAEPTATGALAIYLPDADCDFGDVRTADEPPSLDSGGTNELVRASVKQGETFRVTCDEGEKGSRFNLRGRTLEVWIPRSK